jgi:hypothetical protein
MQLRYVRSGDWFSSYLSMVLSGMIGTFPIVILVFTAWNRNRMKDISLQLRFGAFYEGLKLRSFMHLLCTLLFTVRRLVLVAAAILLSDYPAFQVMLFICLSQLNLIYIVACAPYESKWANVNEAFNECCILMTSYTLILFTDYMDSAEYRDISGFLVISLILFNFLANLLFQFIEVLRKLKLVFLLLKAKFLKKFGSNMRGIVYKDAKEIPKNNPIPEFGKIFDLRNENPNPFSYHLDDDTDPSSAMKKSRDLDQFKSEIAELSGVRGRSFVQKDTNGIEKATAKNQHMSHLGLSSN